MSHSPLPYGWKETGPTCAHSYLLSSVLRALPPPPSTILDVGCGNGFLAGQLARRGYRLTGVDWSPDGIALANKTHPNARFLVASAYDDLHAVTGETFDVVLSTEVIEHLYEPRRLLTNARSAVRPGGLVILTTPYHGYLKNVAMALTGRLDAHFTVEWDGGHIKFFSVRTLSSMARSAGLELVRFLYAGRIPWLWKSMILVARRPEAPAPGVDGG